MLVITRVSKFLNHVDFPAMRDEMLAVAIDHNTEDDVITELADLPFDLYNTKEEVLYIISRKQAIT